MERTLESEPRPRTDIHIDAGVFHMHDEVPVLLTEISGEAKLVEAAHGRTLDEHMLLFYCSQCPPDRTTIALKLSTETILGLLRGRGGGRRSER